MDKNLANLMKKKRENVETIDTSNERENIMQPTQTLKEKKNNPQH